MRKVIEYALVSADGAFDDPVSPALGQSPVTVCALPPLGGRHIAAWHQAAPAHPTPATATVLDALTQTSQASQQTP